MELMAGQPGPPVHPVAHLVQAWRSRIGDAPIRASGQLLINLPRSTLLGRPFANEPDIVKHADFIHGVLDVFPDRTPSDTTLSMAFSRLDLELSLTCHANPMAENIWALQMGSLLKICFMKLRSGGVAG